eukprot:14272982-Alexandrium_andersonii.AAC.1
MQRLLQVTPWRRLGRCQCCTWMRLRSQQGYRAKSPCPGLGIGGSRGPRGSGAAGQRRCASH